MAPSGEVESVVDAQHWWSHTSWMGSHAMPRVERPKRAPNLGQKKWSRVGASRARLALSATRRQLARLIEPTPPPKLSGVVIALDTSGWQRVVRTSQSPGFRTSLVACLTFAWLGTATLSGFAHGPTPQIVRSSTDPSSGGEVEPGQSPGGKPDVSTVGPQPGSDAAPANPAQVEVSDEFLRNYIKVAAELDQQLGREEVHVSSEPALPLSHCPTCSDIPPLGPEQSLDAPQPTGEGPLAPPPMVAIEEPAPQQSSANADQPVSPPMPTDQPPGIAAW